MLTFMDAKDEPAARQAAVQRNAMPQHGMWVVSVLFFRFGFWLLAFGFWLLAFGFWLLAFGFWPLAFGFWLLAVGFWLLASGFWFRSHAPVLPTTRTHCQPSATLTGNPIVWAQRSPTRTQSHANGPNRHANALPRP